MYSLIDNRVISFQNVFTIKPLKSNKPLETQSPLATFDCTPEVFAATAFHGQLGTKTS